MNNQKTVLVTGGAGFIGSHTVDLLLKKGYRVKVLDNLSASGLNGKWPEYLDKRAVKIKGDVCSKRDWKRALKDVNYVIHLAALMDLLPEFSRYFEVNSVGTANLYEVINTYNFPIKKVVIASSQFVYGQGSWSCKKDGVVYPSERSLTNLSKGIWDPKCPMCNGNINYIGCQEDFVDPPNQYAISKFSQELIALKLGKIYNIPSVALRYSIVHGSRQSIKSLYSGALRQFVLNLLFNKQISVYEDGNQLRDFVSVKDVAEANLVVLKNPKTNFQVFNVGGGKSYTVIELAKMVGQVMGRNININIPGEYRFGDIRHGVSDISKLLSLGWSPRRDELDNIREFVDWVKSINPTIDTFRRGVKDLKKKIKLGKIK